jgi:hypothetical protein
MSTRRLQVEGLLEGVPASGELVSALADVKQLRQEVDEKNRELDEALERLRRLTDQAERSTPAAPVAPQPLRPVSAPQNGAPEEALIKATQMAVSGSARSEIEATLREEYKVSDAGRVVEQILGPEQLAPAATGPTEDSPPASSPADPTQD